MKKKIVLLIILIALMIEACGPKPYYRTSEGKKKNKYYNSIPYK